MDYGQAKNILQRIFKEYKVFYDLDEVIEFANMQEQRKEVLEEFKSNLRKFINFKYPEVKK